MPNPPASTDASSGYGLLYEANTRLLLADVAALRGRPCALTDVPECWVAEIADRGFDWVWLMGVWRMGPAGLRFAKAEPRLLAQCRKALPKATAGDLGSSPYAVAGYAVHDPYGGDSALEELRRRLARRGLRLILDFVPNHVAMDHPWVESNPEFFVEGTEKDLARHPENCARVNGRILAHGRDPYFPGWRDTLQLDYSKPAVREAMIGELVGIAGQCDGVRCDMAMLVLNDVFSKTWPGREPPDREFWPEAIARARERNPDFVFIAEAYWGLGDRLCELGFDYSYDKSLYDEMVYENVPAIRDRLRGGAERLARGVHFLENHDEERAASAFKGDRLRPAAALALLLPGLALVHDGQREGRKARLPVQLGRRPYEPLDEGLAAFYDRLLHVARRPEVRKGRWRFLEVRKAWGGSETWQGMVVFLWQADPSERLVCVVNLCDEPGQCFVDLSGLEWGEGDWRFEGLLGADIFEREGTGLTRQGLYLDVPGRASQVFAVGPVA